MTLIITLRAIREFLWNSNCETASPEQTEESMAAVTFARVGGIGLGFSALE